MIREEEYIVIRDLAQEQDITSGHTKSNELPWETDTTKGSFV